MSASFVLASLSGSTYRGVRLATSRTAAALDGHFEDPEMIRSPTDGLGANGLTMKVIGCKITRR